MRNRHANSSGDSPLKRQRWWHSRAVCAHVTCLWQLPDPPSRLGGYCRNRRCQCLTANAGTGSGCRLSLQSSPALTHAVCTATCQKPLRNRCVYSTKVMRPLAAPIVGEGRGCHFGSLVASHACYRHCRVQAEVLFACRAQDVCKFLLFTWQLCAIARRL